MSKHQISIMRIAAAAALFASSVQAAALQYQGCVAIDRDSVGGRAAGNGSNTVPLRPQSPQACSSHCQAGGYAHVAISAQFCSCFKTGPKIVRVYDEAEQRCSWSCDRPSQDSSCGGVDSQTARFLYSYYTSGAAASAEATAAGMNLGGSTSNSSHSSGTRRRRDNYDTWAGSPAAAAAAAPLPYGQAGPSRLVEAPGAEVMPPSSWAVGTATPHRPPPLPPQTTAPVMMGTGVSSFTTSTTQAAPNDQAAATAGRFGNSTAPTGTGTRTESGSGSGGNKGSPVAPPQFTSTVTGFTVAHSGAAGSVREDGSNAVLAMMVAAVMALVLL